MSEVAMSPFTQPDAGELVRSDLKPTGSDLSSVLIHNDDVTPYDYVVRLLGDLFMLSEELAEHVALTAHTKGEAVVVVRPRPEAEKLVKVALGRARLDGYPLRFSVEQE